MVKLNNKAKEIIKTKLRPLLEEDNLKEVVYMLSDWLDLDSDEWEEASDIAAFLYEIGVPILEVIDEIPERLFIATTLESVHIPSNIRVVTKSAFRACDYLTTVTIEDGLEKIFNSAFNSCRSLDSVTLPSTVWAVGSYAFGNIPSLDLTINSYVMFSDDAFKGTAARLYVPKDVLNDSRSQAYQSLEGVYEVIPV